MKPSVSIKNYSKAEFIKLWTTIEKFEGWKPRTIKEYSAKEQITNVKKEAIKLTTLKKINAVVVKRGSICFRFCGGEEIITVFYKKTNDFMLASLEVFPDAD